MPGLLPLLEILYAAAEDEALWPEFLVRLTEDAGADGAGIFLHDLQSGISRGQLVGLDDRAIGHYFGHYAKVSPYLPKGEIVAPMDVVPSDLFLPLHELRRTEFFNDFGRKNNVVHSLGANLGLAEDTFLYLCLNRGEKSGPHPSATVELTESIVPHLRQALRIQEKLKRFAARSAASDRAVWWLSATGHVRDATPNAENLTRAAAALRIDEFGRLTPAVTGEVSPFRKAVGEISVSPLPARRIIRLRARQGEVTLLVSRHSSFQLTTGRPISATVTLLEEGRNPASRLNQLAPAFGLSPAETALLASLLETAELDLTLTILDITRNTAKTQLRSIFRKTGTRSQPALLRLFAALVTSLPE